MMRNKFFSFCIIALLFVTQACSSVPLTQSEDPGDRIKGINQAAENIRSSGERYWIRSLSFWDKNDIVKQLKNSAQSIGRLSRSDKESSVRLAADQQLDELFKSENPLVRLIAFREISNQQTVKQAALKDTLIEVRSIAVTQLKDTAVLTELSKAGDVVGRLARLQLGLLDPVLVKHLHSELSLLVECETRHGRFNDVKMEGYFASVSIKAGEKVFAQGEEHTIIKWRAPLPPGQVQMSTVGYPLGGKEVLAKVKAQAGEVKQVDLNPSDILYNVLASAAFSTDSAKEISNTTRSDDLKQAAVRYLKNKK